LALLASACRFAGDDGAEPRNLRSSKDQARPVDRKILGAAAQYSYDGTLRGREDELLRSQRLRRQLAWRTVEKVLEPVALSQTLPDSGAKPHIPAFHTWYAKDDIERLFQRLYSKLDPEARRRRDPFSDRAIDDAFIWNIHAVEEMPTWPEDRWRDYLKSLDSAEKADGVGGIYRAAYSAEAVRHLLKSYPRVLACMAKGIPDRDAAGPSHEMRPLVRAQLHLEAGERRSVGPWVLGEGETLQSLLDGYQGAAEMRLEPQAADTREPFRILLEAGHHGFDGALALDYDKTNPEWATCTAGTFPIDAVVIKAVWQRVDPEEPMKAYDTSAEGLKKRLEGEVSWEKADTGADPGADRIYTVKLENGNVFRLAGMHIMSKELDHWQWTTLWWSPSPEEDFGADRPSSIDALGAVWRNYKMCSVAGFEEKDPDPQGGFGEDHPSLGKALASAHGGAGGASWCSNPYIERGNGNAGTNCLGCHQHGGSSLRPEKILSDEAQFPAHGRTKVRNNFATDYSWAINGGDRLGTIFKNVVEHDASEAP